jgi:hypothetical protein
MTNMLPRDRAEQILTDHAAGKPASSAKRGAISWHGGIRVAQSGATRCPGLGFRYAFD